MCHHLLRLSSLSAVAMVAEEARDDCDVFGLCRFYLNQLGLLQWNKR